MRKILKLSTEAFKKLKNWRPDNTDILSHFQGVRQRYNKEIWASSELRAASQNKTNRSKKIFFQAINSSQEYGKSTALFLKGRLEKKLKRQEIVSESGPNSTAQETPSTDFVESNLLHKFKCNVLPQTQMKVHPTWTAGSSPTPVHAEGLIPHRSEGAGKRGQGTCANLEPWLGPDPRKRTEER